MISHLKQQLADSRVDGEQLATLRIRETTLETEVQQLLDDLADAKKNYTPVSFGVKERYSLAQACGNSIALAMELPQACAKPLIYFFNIFSFLS